MKTIAYHTLGCKVNQYDTQAMRELFDAAGYEEVDWRNGADIFLINTCTVTGTGDTKSLKLIRRIHREHPHTDIIVCGCLAQRDADALRLPGVRLILGVKQRGLVVGLYERAVLENALVNAVDAQGAWSFEALAVNRHEGRTRAVMKIQEGCDRYCAYCIIPHVRGPVRFMPLADVRREAAHLAEQGYREIVLTGIHLASYGRGIEGDADAAGATAPRPSLIDAVRAVHDTAGILRVRLGSLEPPLITDCFAEALAALPGVCPQFHLSMQSGSVGVLQRMRRRYTPDEYFAAVGRLRQHFPNCAITTDVLTGFPGETDAEAAETLAFVEKVGFARIHVFPYSRREGTVANGLPDQVPEAVKQARATALIALGNQLEAAFVKKLIGRTVPVLMEERTSPGLCGGYSPEYVRVIAAGAPGEVCDIKVESAEGNIAYGPRKDVEFR